MRARDQLIGAVLLVAVVGFGVRRIAEAKSDAEVGGEGVRLAEEATPDFAALARLRSQLDTMGQIQLRARIERLTAEGELWVAPRMTPSRWAAYVESLGIVRRVYVRRVALQEPIRQLYPAGPPAEVPPAYQDALGWLGLAGAMRHEMAHRDGALEESDAYAIELQWYREVQSSRFVTTMSGEPREAWDWAIDSSIRTVVAAARIAGVRLRE